jgi:hypothetical protein
MELIIKPPPIGKTALKQLNSLAFEVLQSKHPGIRPELLPRPAYKDKTSNELTKSIITWIRLNGGQSERISVTGRMIDRREVITDCLGHRRQIGSTQWIKSSMQRGTADISATINGRSVKIEVKLQRDRQSEAQRSYQSQVEKSGGLYYIAKDFQCFYEWYKSTFE